MSRLPILGVTHRRDPDADHRLFEALAGGWSIFYACTAAGYDQVAVDAWRKVDEQFNLAVIGATANGRHHLEDRAKVRAFHGTLKRRVTTEEGDVKEEFEVSDSLAALILKAEKPEKYGTKPAENPTVRVVHTGHDGGPIEVVTRVAPKDRARALAALLAGAEPGELSSILGG